MLKIMKRAFLLLLTVTLTASLLSPAAVAANADAKHIYLTTIPALGDKTGIFEGYVCTESGVRSDPNAYVIYAFLSLDKKDYFEKPYSNSPVTKLESDCFFSVKTVTGGYDYNAKYFDFYLLAASYVPQRLTRNEVAEAAIDHISVERKEQQAVLSPNRTLPKLEVFTVTLDPTGGSVSPARMTCPAKLPTPKKTYTVTYDARGGYVEPGSKTLNCSFRCWNTNANGSGTDYNADETYSTLGNTTLYAKWEDPMVGIPPQPNRAGYTFDGWYTAVTGGTKVDIGTKIHASITVYAHWTEIPKYIVTLNPTGGSVEPTSVTYPQILPTPKKSYKVTCDANGGTVDPKTKTVSCSFLGWDTNNDSNSKGPYANIIYKADKDTTLYAKWKDPAMGALPVPARSHFTFDGWYTAAAGGTKVTNETTVHGNTTIYAHWKEIPKDTVILNPNEGSVSPTSVTCPSKLPTPTKAYTVTYDANGGSVSPKSKSVNCIFRGWNTNADGSGADYSTDEIISTGNALLYAQWSDPTAGRLADPTRSHYTFDGWYTAASGGTKVTSETTIRTNTTLYAHWTEAPKGTVILDPLGGSVGTELIKRSEKLPTPTKAYTVTYNANGGSVEPGVRSLSCTFRGWNTDPDGTDTSYSADTVCTVNNTTLYAQWEDPTAGELAVPTRSGYVFEGWYTAETGGEKVTSETTMRADTTLYAHWTAIAEDRSQVKVTIEKPTKTTVRFFDSLQLHATVENLPKGAKIVWSVEGSAIRILKKSGACSVSGHAADCRVCRVSARKSGTANVICTVYDENGDPLLRDGKAISASVSLTGRCNYYILLLPLSLIVLLIVLCIVWHRKRARRRANRP